MARNTDVDHIYYNANMVNNNTSTGGLQLDPSVVFEDDRTTPLIRDISKFELMVQSISINGALKNVPVIIPQIYIDPVTQTIVDINKTIYQVSFTWSNGITTYTDTQDIRWIPQNRESPPPEPGSRTQLISGDYYYCYSYRHFCNLINNALTLAYNTVKSNAGAGWGGTLVPFFSYNRDTRTFSVFEDSKTSIVPYGQFLPSPYSQYQAALSGGVTSATQVAVALGAQIFTSSLDAASTVLVAGDVIDGISLETGDLFQATITTFVGTVLDVVITSVTPGPSGTVQLSGNWSIVTTTPVATGSYQPFEFSSVGFDTNFSGLLAGFDQVYYGKDNVVMGYAGGSPVYYPQYVIRAYPTNEQPFLGWYSGTNFDTTGSPAVNSGVLPNPFTSLIGITTSSQIYICMTEEESSVETLWSPVRSLVLSSTSIPTINEYSSSPVITGGQNLGYNQTSGGNFDFTLIEIQLDTNSLDYYHYVPPTENYTAMSISHEPLSKIQLSMWWRNRLNNQLYPVQLYNLGSVSVRLRFKMKSA
jgi:hypothetical protein